jgi:hypothetical protein
MPHISRKVGSSREVGRPLKISHSLSIQPHTFINVSAHLEMWQISTEVRPPLEMWVEIYKCGQTFMNVALLSNSGWTARIVLAVLEEMDTVRKELSRYHEKIWRQNQGHQNGNTIIHKNQKP